MTVLIVIHCRIYHVPLELRHAMIFRQNRFARYLNV